MAKRRTKPYPGSIYRRSGYSSRLYVEYRGETIATGLADTPENRKVAQELLWTLWRREHGLERPQANVRLVSPDEAWHEYELHLVAADRSVRTITGYRDAFAKLRPSELTAVQIVKAVEVFLRQWHGSPSSINIYLRNYQPFLKWAHKRGYVDDVPELSTYLRRGVGKDVQVLSQADVAAVLEYLRADNDYDLADLVEVMYLTGLRISEAMNLSRQQIVTVDGIRAIRISNKTSRKPEYLPISRKLDEILQRRPGPDRYFRWSSQSRSKLNRRFNAALTAVGIDGKTGFHLLRKSFRHRLQVAGVPVDAAKRLMRHSNLRVTDEHYTLYETTTLAEILDGLDE